MSKSLFHILSSVQQTMILGLLLLVVCSCRVDSSEESTTPNLVLIVVDALRASNVSFLGYERSTTPHLDALSKRSFVFEQAISVGGNTPTAMSALMTGRYPFFSFDEEWAPTSFGMRRFYMTEAESGIPSGLDTLAERLGAAGYTTIGVITNPYLKSTFNFHRGFDQYKEIFREKGIPYGQGEMVSKEGIEFLRSDFEPPYFLYLHYMDTHGPYSPPGSYRTKFDESDWSISKAGELWTQWEKNLPSDTQERAALASHMRNLYDGAVSYVDDCIGQIIGTLEELGQMENTIVAVTADHGEEFLEHGGTTHKGTLYEELVHIPLLVFSPRRNGARIQDLVRNFDLMPTFLDFAGVDVADEELDAVSLRPLMEGRAENLNLFAYAGFPTIRMLRTPRYKLLQHRGNRKEFYDLQVDPGEQNDLYLAERSGAGSNVARRIASMEKVLERLEVFFLATLTSEGHQLSPLDQMTEDQLRALGYLD